MPESTASEGAPPAWAAELEEARRDREALHSRLNNIEMLLTRASELLVQQQQQAQMAAPLLYAADLSAANQAQRHILDDPRACLLYTSPSPRDGLLSRMPSSA